MIGYVLPGASPATAKADPRMRRLASAGPWQFQHHADGVLATWAQEEGPRSFASFGEGRKTDDGLIYLPPKTLPMPEDLLKPAFLTRADAHKISVETEQGTVTLTVVPAYCTPRKILENNDLGDYATSYARRALALLGRLSSGVDVRVTDVGPDLFDVCREAVLMTTRCTKELISDCGWITEDSCWDIWRAVIHVPKALSSLDSGPSVPSSQSATSKESS